MRVCGCVPSFALRRREPDAAADATSMFERFTERARHVVVAAQEEARALERGYIGTEHLLLGLLREREGLDLAARVLGDLGIAAEPVRARIVEIAGSGDKPRRRQIPFAPRAKKVLELALREALSLRHNYIGTEHLLLGLVRENGGLAARVLLEFGADAEKIRSEVIRALDGPGGRRAADPPDPEHATAVGPPDVAVAGKEFPDTRSLSAQALDDLIKALIDEEQIITHRQAEVRAKLEILLAERRHRREQGGESPS